MSRYTGPRLKKLRALGSELPGLTRKDASKRPFPPGQHGQRRRKDTEFRRQLVEKQKLRFNYGVTERQLRTLVAEAKRGKVAPDEALLVLLERLSDNVVFRAGLAPTIPAARQLILHGHVQLNGKRVDRPAVRLEVGDVITVRDKTKNNANVQASWQQRRLELPSWIKVDDAAYSVTVTELPVRSEVPLDVTTSLVMEYYAQRG